MTKTEVLCIVPRRWAIVTAALICGAVLPSLGCRVHWPAARVATQRVKVSTVPFSHDIVLEPGDAYSFELPNGRTLAVWGRENTEIIVRTVRTMAKDIRFRYGEEALEELEPEESGVPSGNNISREELSYMLTMGKDTCFGYGEKPFEELASEEIQLPSGNSTSGEFLSYIRSGPVYFSDIAEPSEHILYVEQYRISLKERDINDRNLPMTVSVRLASEKERIRPKQKVDFYIGRLRAADSGIQLDAMQELRRLLRLGNVYARPRRKEITVVQRERQGHGQG